MRSSFLFGFRWACILFIYLFIMYFIYLFIIFVCACVLVWGVVYVRVGRCGLHDKPLNVEWHILPLNLMHAIIQALWLCAILVLPFISPLVPLWG